MARNKISLKDKAVVKKKLAQGMSYRQAMVGTKIKSKNTVMLIAKEEKDDIGRLREEYIAMLERFGADAESRAKALAEIVTAKKPAGKNAKLYPDWRSRLEAIKYIDSLAGVNTKEEKTRINILNNPAFLAKYSRAG